MDLHSAAPFWLLRHGWMRDRPPLSGTESAAVCIVGAGITGALVGDRLSAAGLDVVLLDRRIPGSGSTAANTALLTGDLDIPLHRLIERIGMERALRAYRAVRSALEELERLCRKLPEEIAWHRRPSLFLARGRKGGKEIEREYLCRREHGFEVEALGPEELAAEYGIERESAIRTPFGGEVDPYLLTGALLERIESRGGRVYGRTRVVEWRSEARGIVLVTESGATVRAAWGIAATGYEGEGDLGSRFVRLSSTFAVATHPLPPLPRWTDRAVIWETGPGYLYLRRTDDDRIFYGGGDIPFRNTLFRDRSLRRKTRQLTERMKALFPGMPIRPAHAWAGTFGTTSDGLPCIGPHPDHPRRLHAHGYGGNGILGGMLAALVLSEICRGRVHPEADLFALDRFPGEE